MKQKTNTNIKHLSIFVLFVFYGVLAVGSLADSPKKGIKLYYNGEYNQAVETLKSSSINDRSDKFYFLGMSYKALGNDYEAGAALVKSYELCQKEEKSYLEKKYPKEYQKLVTNIDTIKQEFAAAEKKKKATANVGKWTLFQVDDRMSKTKITSDSWYYSSVHKPKAHITLTSDGRIEPSLVGNATYYYWRYNESDGFKVTDSSGEVKGGMNPQGYLQINTLTIDSKGKPHYISVFYTKD